MNYVLHLLYQNKNRLKVYTLALSLLKIRHTLLKHKTFKPKIKNYMWNIYLQITSNFCKITTKLYKPYWERAHNTDSSRRNLFSARCSYTF